MTDKNRVPPGPGFIKNRGGRPRKDGTRADNSTTLAQLGVDKRTAALARLYASVPEDEFEAAIDRRNEIISKGGRVPSLASLLPDRKANSRHDRETRANIARIISTARLIVEATEFNSSPRAERLRSLAQATIDLWSTGLVDDRTAIADDNATLDLRCAKN
jgi:hypothetical protein